MSKLGFMATLLSALWLTMAAIHNSPVVDLTQTSPSSADELQAMEAEHLNHGADPAAWGRVLEEHADHVAADE